MKIMRKLCRTCSKSFLTYSESKEHCSKQCKKDAAKRRQMESDQPCWHCQKACGGCDWSGFFKPVPGWVATAVTLKDEEGDIRSYQIHKCPQFVRG